MTDFASLTDHLEELLEAAKSKRAEYEALLEQPTTAADISWLALQLMRSEVRTLSRKLVDAEIAIAAASAAATRLEILAGAYQEETA